MSPITAFFRGNNIVIGTLEFYMCQFFYAHKLPFSKYLTPFFSGLFASDKLGYLNLSLRLRICGTQSALISL